jgi:hypothetical protein
VNQHDQDIIGLCAKAMQIRHELDEDGSYYDDAGSLRTYNPLQNDEQAMALVKMFRLSVMAAPMTGWIAHGGEDDTFTKAESTDINRAIVECVAKLRHSAASSRTSEEK